MRKLVLACGILAGVVSVSMGAMSDEEWQRARHNCSGNEDKSACQALINDGLPSVEQCDKDTCGFVGSIYGIAGRYKEAIPYFEKLIALGDNRGYGALANVYDNLQDYYNAKKYYEIACNKGDGDVLQSESCYNLGVMYDSGRGVRQDYYNAKKYYEIACNKGDGDVLQSESCHNLGVMYYDGRGVRQDYYKAHELFKKACDMKYAAACYNIGVLYDRGEGVRQDYYKAHEFYKKACDMKYAAACNNLGALYGKGQGVRQNLSTAKQYYGKACDLGSQLGCDNYKKIQ